MNGPFGLVWLAEESLDSLICRWSQSNWLKYCSVKLKTALSKFIGLTIVVSSISKYQQQRHNHCSYKQDVILYSTTAADVLAPLLLDLKKVNAESSIFIIEFENLTASFFWLLICWWYFSFPQRLSKNVRYSVHNVNVNTFSFSIKLLLGENTFLWNISGRLLRVDILHKSYSENF